MASDAEVDLVVNASRALGEVQRDLDRLVRVAETTTDPVQLRAALDRQASLRALSVSLQRTIADAERRAGAVNVPVRFDVDRDSFRRFDDQARSLAQTATRALGAVGGLAAILGTLGAAAGAAAPVLAGVVAAAQQLAPAAAVATQGILAMQLASGTLKLALSGVEEAISTAFDPEASPEDLAKAMERLAPNAKAFVTELRSMRKGLDTLRLDTQNLLFDQLAGHLGGLARRVLPVARDAIRNTAIVLNDMALGAANAAGELAENGTLRTALQGTVRGLRNLEDVPGRAVTAFGQLAAAAAPAFARITQAVDRLSRSVSEKLTKAFESGALTSAVDDAISAFAQLGRVGGNVLGSLQNVFNAVSADGEGLFGTLERVTGQIEKITASRGFQDTLGALASVMRTIAAEVGPLLLNIFGELGPVFQALQVPVENLARFLGENLNKAVNALGPVLETLAVTLGKTLAFVQPLLQIVLNLAIAALPSLQRAFEFVGSVLERLTPGFTRLAEASGPLFEQLSKLHLLLQDKLFGVLEKILGPLLAMANLGLQGVATIIEEVVVPQLEILNALLEGDSTTAFNKFIALGNRVNEFVGKAFEALKVRVVNAINTMAASAQARFNAFLVSLVASAQAKLNEVVRFFQNLPSRIAGALGNLGNVLVSAGAAIVDGMIRGVQGRIGALIGTLADLAARARATVADVLGIASPSKEFAKLGDFMVQGIQVGLERSANALRNDLRGLALSLPSAAGTPLSLSNAPTLAPTFNVFVGNQLLDSRTDARIDRALGQRDKVLSQGRRR